MNMRHWIQEQIKAPAKQAIPILSFPSIQLLGVTVRELCSSAELQAEGMARVAQRVPSGASLSMMDLSVEAEAFGAQIRISDGEVPTVKGALICDEEGAAALQVPKVGAGRTGRYVEAVGKALRRIDDRPVLGGVIGPFSLAGRLMEVSEALLNCIAEPDMVHAAMDKATRFLIEYALAYKAVGAHGLMMAEPLAGLLSPALAAEFSEPYARRIVQAVQDDSFSVIYHNCGNNTPLMIGSILRVGAMGYHFGDSIDMAEMLKAIPEDALVLGNISPSRQFLSGTPASIREDTLRVMGACCPEHPNFVISSGCDVPPLSPWENTDAFFGAVAEYYMEN